MNKILYTSGEFYLLQDWPDVSSHKYENDPYKFMIEKSKTNKIKIANPGLLPVVKALSWFWFYPKEVRIEDGDTFDFPGAYGIKAIPEIHKICLKYEIYPEC